MLKNVNSKFVCPTDVAVEKQFLLIDLNVCALCYAQCKARAACCILMGGLTPSAVSFTIFQISSFKKLTDNRMIFLNFSKV
jgi:hypothetical protein